ncbi:mucin-2-like [Musca domestica]|uniref:Mucin-2-like n=1 Tax=Musca domestica TaxID=7370 RepID=A0A9J7IEQ4_MUSDO|nr:mucin-2-like [Musca domestica]
MKAIFLISVICLMALSSRATIVPWATSQHPSSFLYRPHGGFHPSGPVCGVLNGYYKTFYNLQQFLDYNKNGYAFTFYCTGPCPPAVHNACPTTFDPVCATNLVETKTFSSPCAVQEETYRTGITWIQISTGFCHVPPPETSSTAAPVITPSTPEVTEAPATTPEVTTPEVTTPETTTPEPTTEETTTPEVTTPETTTPEPSTDETATPEDTTPEVTTPEVTTPEVTTPEPTTPEASTDPTTDDSLLENNTSDPSFAVGALNEILTPPESQFDPSSAFYFAQFLSALQSSPFKGLPNGSVLSYRNNVGNDYGIYAEGNVFNNAPL